MSNVSNGGRRGLAAAALFAALLTASACGEQSGVVNDLGGAVPGSVPSASQQGQSEKAQDADARRAAQGQLPSPSVPVRRQRPNALP
jgi:hypothetical protein